MNTPHTTHSAASELINNARSLCHMFRRSSSRVLIRTPPQQGRPQATEHYPNNKRGEVVLEYPPKGSCERLCNVAATMAWLDTSHCSASCTSTSTNTSTTITVVQTAATSAPCHHRRDGRRHHHQQQQHHHRQQQQQQQHTHDCGGDQEVIQKYRHPY